jgi:hypothetical protein
LKSSSQSVGIASLIRVQDSQMVLVAREIAELLE